MNKMQAMLRYLFIILLMLPLCVKGQVITTVAGNGMLGQGGDGGLATSAELYQPGQVAIDAFGNLFIGDGFNHKIRKVNTITGIISTYVGNGTIGYSGDGGLATNAQLKNPGGMAIDSIGNLFFVDNNHVIRKVDVITGLISTIAGTGTAGFNGDGGLPNVTQLNYPGHLAFDDAGNLYISEVGNRRIRKITTGNTVTTVAGTGAIGYSGDGGLAVNAQINSPSGLVCDGQGNIYFSDNSNGRTRKIDITTGLITTIAGDGTFSYNGDGVLATSVSVDSKGLAFDKAGNLYLAEINSDRIRKIDANGIINTVVGSGTNGFSGDGGLATSAMLNGPIGISFDTCGNLYIGDNQNKRIRKVTFEPNCPSSTTSASIQKTSFSLYPNPANTHLTIKGENLQSINITNTLGQIVHSQKATQGKTVVDISALNAGVYFVTVTDNQGGKVTKKVVKE